MKLCEICSVFRHEILSILNNTPEILHPYTNYSIYLVVTIVQFVLHIVAIEDLDSLGHHNPKRTSVLIALSTSEELDCPITTGRNVLS